jgi:hypothetical protein
MNIGIIGSGNMAASIGKDPQELRHVADAAGPKARCGTPAETVATVLADPTTKPLDDPA